MKYNIFYYKKKNLLLKIMSDNTTLFHLITCPAVKKARSWRIFNSRTVSFSPPLRDNLSINFAYNISSTAFKSFLFLFALIGYIESVNNFYAEFLYMHLLPHIPFPNIFSPFFLSHIL